MTISPPYRKARANNSPIRGVTIAIPNWNHELYLPRVIKTSLKACEELMKNGVDCEILIIDDFSRDGSITLLKQLEALYFQRGLRLLINEKNLGVVATRNRAIAESTYRYILFVDADNELAAENVPAFFKSIEQTQAAAVYGNLLVHHPGIGLTGLFSSETVQHSLRNGNYIDACALYDKEQLEEVAGFQNNLRMQAHEDWELFLHLSAAGRKIVFVPLIMGKYNFMPNSHVSNVSDEDSIEDRESHVSRVYDQRGIRNAQRFNSQHLRYHPDIGYI